MGSALFARSHLISEPGPEPGSIPFLQFNSNNNNSNSIPNPVQNP